MFCVILLCAFYIFSIFIFYIYYSDLSISTRYLFHSASLSIVEFFILCYLNLFVIWILNILMIYLLFYFNLTTITSIPVLNLWTSIRFCYLFLLLFAFVYMRIYLFVKLHVRGSGASINISLFYTICYFGLFVLSCWCIHDGWGNGYDGMAVMEWLWRVESDMASKKEYLIFWKQKDWNTLFWLDKNNILFYPSFPLCVYPSTLSQQKRKLFSQYQLPSWYNNKVYFSLSTPLLFCIEINVRP